MPIEDVLPMDLHNKTQIWSIVTPLISYALLETFFLFNFFLLTGPMCLLGIFTNIANIIVYCKMGFSETSNVNFLVLSGFDLFVSLISLVARGLMNPLLRQLSNWPVLNYMSHAHSYAMIVVISGSAMMTALISTERCVCVVFPLKVKTWLSRRRSFGLVMIIITYHLVFLVFLYADPGPPYDAYPQKQAFYIFCMYTIPSTTCFFIVVFSTIFLVISLRRNQRWRRETATQSGKSSGREDRLVRTIVAISVMFIICTFPNASILLVQMVYPSFNSHNPYLGTFTYFIYAIGSGLQALSSSVNIFFYYSMSSRFQKVFSAYFSLKKQTSRIAS